MFACEKDTTYLNEDVSPVFNPLDCLERDCATGTNSLVLPTPSLRKSEMPLLGIQRAYSEQYSVEEHLARLQSDGYPAWDALLTVDVSEDYKHYLVPVYKTTSDKVEAVISIIHYLGHGMARIDYLDRDDIDSYISYYDSILASKFQQELGGRKFTKEALIYIHLSLDYELFGYYDTDVLDILPQEGTQGFFAKDCKITVNYVSETHWFTYNGGTLVDISSSYSFTSETSISDGVGCGGGTPPGGPGVFGTNGGGPVINPNGPGTVIININPNDPDNRCIEDGVGCEDEEEEDEELLRVNNAIDRIRFPCAWQVVNEILGTQANTTDNINVAINNIFTNNDRVNLTIRSAPDLSAIPGIAPGDGNREAYYRTILSRVNQNGDQVHFGEIFLEEGSIGCTRDYTRGLLMHEAIHGYVDYQRAALSESDFLRDFPLFASGSDEEEHEGMAIDYINSLRSTLRSHNQQISNFMIDLIAWSGLQETDAYTNWKNRMPYGPSFPPERIQEAMNTFSNASSTNCGNGLPSGENLGSYNFDTCN